MAMRGQTVSPFGEKPKHDPRFGGPIRNRSCTDVNCCLIFTVFFVGYMMVGILACKYGDPRQAIYARNSTGAYCGIGENRDKPFVFYLNIMKCATSTINGRQCPTPQICVPSCPSKFWAVPPEIIRKDKPEDIWDQTQCQPAIDLRTTNLSVSEIINLQLCPEITVPCKPVMNRCVPTFDTAQAEFLNVTWMDKKTILDTIKNGTEQLVQALGAKRLGLKIVEDFTRSWEWILMGLLIAMALSLIFVVLLGYIAKFLVWAIIYWVLVAMACGICHCYMEYQKLDQEGATINNVGFTTDVGAYSSVKETWFATLIILCVVEVIMMLTVVFLRKQIMMAIALIEEAGRAIGYMTSSLLYPLVTFLLLVICVTYWGITALYLATSGAPLYRIVPNIDNSSDCIGISGEESCSPQTFNASTYLPCMVDCIFFKYNDEGLFQRIIFYLQIYNFVGLLWSINIVIALGQCVLAGAFASYYWALRKPQNIPTCAVCRAFAQTIRYHIGSLAFGSFILTIVQLIRIVLEYVAHNLKDSSNKAAEFLLCCLDCCFGCLETFLKFLNRNAYIMIAIYGDNFCVSAKNAFMLLMRNTDRVVVLDKVTDLLLFFGKLLIVGGVGFLSFFFFTGRIPTDNPEFKAPVLNYYWLPILTVVVGAYFIAQGFFSVYSMCVDTLFLCFLEDLERNDGSPRKPYYMSKSLMDILNKENKDVEAKYHIGSLAFGSFILTIVQLIRIVLEYMAHNLKDSSNKAAGCLLCCLNYCFSCLETSVKFLNRNAYIMIAIYGDDFCVSAKNAFMLLMRNTARVVVLDKVTDLLLLFGKLLIVGGVGILSFFFFTGRIPTDNPEFKSPVLNYYWLPILTVVVGAYFIAQGFFSVYSMCVDTLFLCFLEDLERNDGSPRKPYYMSKSLMNILNKENKDVEAK